MLRINVYIPEELDKKLEFTARSKRKAKAAVIREALGEGLEKLYPITSSAQALLEFAREAEKIPTKGKAPKDVSINHDYYAWGGEKRKNG